MYPPEERGLQGVAGSIVAITLAIVLSLGLLWGMVWGYQYFKVFKATYSGKAVLAEAEYSRQVAVKEAQAKKDSAILLAEAEVYRADGVAKANAIIANGLGGPEGYLRYLYIHMLEGQQNQIIYLPTEAGLPILEANRLR